jgi:hypothetical protein
MDQSEHKIMRTQQIKQPGLVPGFLLEPGVDKETEPKLKGLPDVKN